MKKSISAILFSSLITFQILGADTTKIVPNEAINITVGITCKTITNTNPNSIFAPSGNANDFTAFISHPPAGISIANCVVVPSINCVGTWEACTGTCGTTGTQTFTVTTSASTTGVACPSSPQSCTMPACLNNGLCGTASNIATNSIPTTNLCSAGTATAVMGNGPWNWSCLGSGGGSNAACSSSSACTGFSWKGGCYHAGTFAGQTCDHICSLYGGCNATKLADIQTSSSCADVANQLISHTGYYGEAISAGCSKSTANNHLFTSAGWPVLPFAAASASCNGSMLYSIRICACNN